MNIKKIIREEIGDFDWIRNTNPLDIIATSFLNKVAVRRHSPYAYVRQWNYNMPYHVINKKNYGFRDSYERLKNKFFDYLDEGIISDVPLDVIPMIHKRMLSPKDKEYIWEKVVSEVLNKMGFDPNINESKEDDFDWVVDIKTPKDNVIIYSNSSIDYEKRLKILGWIESTFPGVKWNGGEYPTEFVPKNRRLRYFLITNNNLHWGYSQQEELLKYHNHFYFININDIFVNDLNESEEDDFGFVGNTPELHGVSFKVNGHEKPIYTIIDKGHRYYVDVTWPNNDGEPSQTKRSMAMKLFRNGTWIPIV